MKISEIIENSKRQLSELFQEPADWQWEYPLRAGSNQAIATFEVGKHEYTWLANRSDDDWGEWTIEFEENTLGHGITGTGNATTVFSTVVDITDLFIRRSNAYKLVFSSKEPSRTKLYLSMVRRLLPTWKLTQDGNVITVRKPDVLSSHDDKTVGESASAGATSSASIGTVINPHHSPGTARGKKSYIGDPWGGKSGTKSPPRPKVVQPKNPDGTAKGAHNIKGASLFGGPPVKR